MFINHQYLVKTRSEFYLNMENKEISKYVAKTGTTILGIKCKDGHVMGSDRRVTAGGQIVVKKDFQKTIRINDYLLMSVAGNAADAKMQAKLAAAELRLKELKTKARPTVKEAANLIANLSYRNIRTPSMIPSIVGSIVGGFNEDGTTELYTIEPAGGIDEVTDYDANFGSGMAFVLGYLERLYKPDISVKDAIKLAVESLKSSTQRDTASGNGIDVYSITKEGIVHEVSEVITPNYK
jgi:proteasome beta subunit